MLSSIPVKFNVQHKTKKPIVKYNQKITRASALDDINNKRKENVLNTIDILKKNLKQDLEYIELFERRKLARLNDVLNDLKLFSEKDLKYIQELYELVNTNNKFETKSDNSEDNVESVQSLETVKSDNDEFFEA